MLAGIDIMLKGQVMRLISMLTVLLLACNCLAVCQAVEPNSIETLLDQGRRLQQHGDYLYAARVFRYVAQLSTDSLQQAEALYRYVTCGDQAIRILGLRQVISQAIGLTTTFDELAAPFDSIGIRIRMAQYFESYYVNVDTSTRQILATRYSKTPWGELATYDLIENELSWDGTPLFNDPHIVVERARAFHLRYPNSKLKYDVHFILGRAYQDLWSFFHKGYYKDMLTDSERANPDSIRLESIRQLETAKKSRRQLQKRSWSEADDKLLKQLREGQETRGYFYFGD